MTVSAVDPIKHVIVLMFENHSFDQMLGCFKSEPGFEGLEGVDPDNPSINLDSDGNEYPQTPSTDAVVSPDPKHELEHVRVQLDGRNSGFVLDYERSYGATPQQRQRIMSFHPVDFLTALHTLARHFTVCDHWYSSMPGPTWANRFFVHSGTSVGRVTMPEGWDQTPSLYLGYDQNTIYDRLSQAGIPWRIYHGDVPQSLVLSHQRTDDHAACYEWMERFFDDVNGPEPAFPAYSFIEPRYFHIPSERPQNDDHPPHSTFPAQSLLADVYNALIGNEALWNSSLLVVVYDEHGGFFDHVVPPAATPPDRFDSEYNFRQFGLRVPALLVSPWTERRVLATPFDHTSILNYAIEKWGLGPLTERVRSANTIAAAISVASNPRRDTPGPIQMPLALMKTTPGDLAPETPASELNENQKALLGLSKFLEAQTPVTARPKLAAMASPNPAYAARERVAAYLNHKKASRLA